MFICPCFITSTLFLTKMWMVANCPCLITCLLPLPDCLYSALMLLALSFTCFPCLTAYMLLMGNWFHTSIVWLLTHCPWETGCKLPLPYYLSAAPTWLLMHCPWVTYLYVSFPCFPCLTDYMLPMSLLVPYCLWLIDAYYPASLLVYYPLPTDDHTALDITRPFYVYNSPDIIVSSICTPPWRISVSWFLGFL